MPAEALFTERLELYARLLALTRYPDGLRAFFLRSDALGPNLRVLDAGCGPGTVTLAVHAALARRGWSWSRLDAFDLTPAMLDRYRCELTGRKLSEVRLQRADVRSLDRSLMPDWTGYDLIVSSGMLEYVERSELPAALAALRDPLAPSGRFLLFVSRRSPVSAWLLERWWRANCYSRLEITTALRAARFGSISHRRFPWPYAWLNGSGDVPTPRACRPVEAV